MNVTVTIDRFEGDFAVLEVGGQFVDWPRAALPPEAMEGWRYTLSFVAEPANDENEERLARLKKRTPQTGDIDL